MNNQLRKALPYILTPFSYLYGAVAFVRNWLFDHKALPIEEFDVPVISVGNISIGGTGKTPHVEYLVGQLCSTYKIAVLSRGYKRKTKGFIIANSKSTPDVIGDEPLQIYRKYSSFVKVAVCENRRKGINELLRVFPDTQLIILDDAFQHRYVKPKVNILLTEYNRLFTKDHLLPLGRLRESPASAYRADMVIVTKCPADIRPLDIRITSKSLALMPYQELFFSRYSYGELRPVFPDENPYYVDLTSLTYKDTVVLLTGIANPGGFIRHFSRYPFKVRVSYFPDHHDFSRDDIKSIENMFESSRGERKLIITTEKDAVRLAYNPYFPEALKPFVFYMPISVEMIPGLNNADLIFSLKKLISHND